MFMLLYMYMHQLFCTLVIYHLKLLIALIPVVKFVSNLQVFLNSCNKKNLCMLLKQLI